MLQHGVEFELQLEGNEVNHEIKGNSVLEVEVTVV
jgi:hypothetical protein